MTSGDRLIRWVCIARSHRRTSDLGLTRHDDGWALCPDLLSQGHEWSDVGGLEVRDAVARWHELVGMTEPSAPAA